MAHLSPEEALRSVSEAAKAKPVDEFTKAKQHSMEIYKKFETEMDVDTVMTRSEFAKYEKLYSKTYAQDAYDDKLTQDEVNDLNELSEEFYHRVNVQKPIHIVDDYTHEELFVLPPIFARLNPIAGKNAEIIDIYNGVHDSSKDDQGPMMEMKRDMVDRELIKTFTNNQQQNSISAQMKQFEDITRKFHQTVLGDDPFDENAPKLTKEQAVANQKLQAKNADNQNSATSSDDPDDGFDFR